MRAPAAVDRVGANKQIDVLMAWVTSKQPAQRLRTSPEHVRSAVHQAVIDLLSDPGGVDLTIPAVAQRAGVNHTSIYRRWGSREALLADVVVTRLERDSPPADTGTLRGDLRAWAEAGAASIRTPEGRTAHPLLVDRLLGSPETPRPA
ncbi:Transcriptional regulator, TetR family [Streptomyces sp. ADI95-16]|nr:Transcriptional regulator, TetR family [Streptomyces sp. ADI95-16]